MTFFNHARFQGETDFTNTKFQCNSNAEFRDNAEFQGWAFFGDADFSHSKLTRTANRSGSADVAGQSQAPNASASRPRGGTFQLFDFSGGSIGGVARFNNRIFNEPAAFSDRTFVEAPHFHGSELHQGTIWEGARFLEREGEDAGNAYRTLRFAMDRIKDRSQEGVFFELEQIAIRSTLPGWNLNRWLSFLYAWTSAYGKSTVLPLLWLIATTILFFVFYTVLDGCSIFAECMAEPLVSFTMQQMTRPFWIWSGYCAAPAQLFGGAVTLGLKALATLQSITSLALIGLFVLALRWRFRRA